MPCLRSAKCETITLGETMPPRRKGQQRRQQPSSDSDSDSDGPGTLSEELYSSLELSAALRRPADYATAAGEAAALLRHFGGSGGSGGRCDKKVLAAMAEDASLAIDCCDR